MESASYPFTSRFLSLGGVRLHYLDEGPRHGSPVVMLHGNPAWSFYYRKLVLDLHDDFRCLVPDYIGMGLSDKPGDKAYDYSLGRRVDDLEALLTRLTANAPLTLVMHDWGGLVGMVYAARHPERIGRLVVMNAAGFHLPGENPLPPSVRQARTWMGPVLARGLNTVARRALEKGEAGLAVLGELKEEYLAPYDSWGHRIGPLRFAQDLPVAPGQNSYDLMSEVEQKLQRLRHTPALICWGMKDPVFSGQFLREWLRRFPDADVHRFDQAGRYLLEDAGDEVIPLIRKFLERRK